MQKQQRSTTPSPNLEMELPESDNSWQMFLSLTREHDRGQGITLNRVSADPELPGNDSIATEEEEEKSQAKEAAPVTPAAENVSGVRKMLLNPAEEALESARQTAELILKDALDALLRSRQRIMQSLPHSLVSPSANAQAAAAAEKASKAVEEAKQKILENFKAVTPASMTVGESDNQENEKSTEELSSIQQKIITTEPAMGLIHPLWPPPSASMELVIPLQSKL